MMNDLVAAARLAAFLRRRGIRDRRVLEAIGAVPRDIFVQPAFEAVAYADEALPIECGQTISQPFIVAYMTEKLAPEKTARVLEIGTGSGYQTAILAHLFGHVFSMEVHEPLSRAAAQRLKRLGLHNTTLICGDGNKGWESEAPFDRIIVTAAACDIPPALVQQLKRGGRLIAPIGAVNGPQRLVLAVKTDMGLARKTLLPVRFVPLTNINRNGTNSGGMDEFV